MNASTRRTALLGATAPAALAAAIGCSGPAVNRATDGATTSQGQGGGEPAGEIVFLNLGAADEMGIYDQVRDRFQALYPKGKVTIDLVPSAELSQKLQALMAAGSPPDVFNVGYNEVSTYVAANGLLDLERTVQQRAKELGVDDFFPGEIDRYRYKGHLWAIPHSGGVQVIPYNADLLASASIRPPGPAWTWDEYLDAAKRLTQPGADGVARYGSTTGSWQSWVYTNGGRIVDDAGRRCLLASTEAIDALQFWQDLTWKHQVAPPPEALRAQNAESMMRAGRLAMNVGLVRADVGRLVQGAAFKVEAARHPRKKTARAQGVSNAAGVSKATKAPALAVAFAFFYSGEGQLVRLDAGRSIVPARRSVARSPVYLDKVLPREQNQLFVSLKEGGDWLPYPEVIVPNFTEFNRIVNEEIGALRDNRRTAADVARSLATRLDAHLSAG
ncbi:MAG: sugar ABC transporter substrate-binding protein [Chloroflexi bacterium]|nr:sugar ABC transporter substrate-binding protein [Chloroflexota bacterium]